MRWFNERLTKEIEKWDLIVKNISKSIENEFLNFDSDDDADEDIPSTLSPNTRRSTGWSKNKCNRNSLKHDKNQSKKLYHYNQYNKIEYNRKTYIIIKFRSFAAMLIAVKRFNKIAKKVQSTMHLASRTYYKNGLTRISSREFKILNVSETTSKKEIESAIRKLLKSRHPFL